MRLSPKVNQLSRLKILALISSVLISIAACSLPKPSLKTYKALQSFEKLKKLVVFNGCRKLLVHKGANIISESREEGLLKTGWFYFFKPGINWRYRFCLILSISEGENNTIDLAVMSRYQRGMPIRQLPFSPNLIGYGWKDIRQDMYLIRYIDDFFIELKNYLDPMKSNIILENPQKVQRIVFRLSGIPPERIMSFPYDDGSQELLEIKDEYAVIQTSSQMIQEKEAIPFPVVDDRLSKFLGPSDFCQSEDRLIKEKAREIVGDERNSWRAVKKISEWLKKEMRPTYYFSFASAKEVLETLEGDCTEYTVLAIALCRAVGIPARAAVGVKYDEGIFNYHMWLEAYVGRWINLDPQFLSVDEASGEYYTDAAHLKFFRSNLGKNTFREMNRAIGGIIEKLKLEILDYGEER